MADPATSAGRAAVLVATAGGLGLLRPAPGTWGSLGGAALGLVLLLACPPQLAPWALGAAALAATAAGLLACPAACRRFRRGDPSEVVIDEVAGVLTALALIPAAPASPLAATGLAFLLFRVFDIAKPWPVRWCEALPGPLGIMADDLAAGLLAGILAAAALG